MCVCVREREREREYRLSEHSLCVETGRHKQSWRARGASLGVSKLEADIFSGIPRDGKQNRYESRDWDGRGKNVIGSGRDRE